MIALQKATAVLLTLLSLSDQISIAAADHVSYPHLQRRQTYPNISADEIASIIASTGVLPAGLAGVAGGIVLSVLQTSESQIEAATAGCTTQKCQDPESFYSYGQSPAVYPSPQSNGTGGWASAYQTARQMVSQMTDTEKEMVVTPASNFNGCSGYSNAISRVGWPGLCLNDNGNSVHLPGGNITGFPAGLSVAAGWNRNATLQRAVALGKEFKAMGINVALGPVVGPLGRIAKGGRFWEGLSNDPFLAGQLAAQSIQGIQQSVIACIKHFVAYEQETNRQPFLNGLLAQLGVNVNNSVSSNVDDRTMHELYLWPFADAVRAGVGSVMASYNRVNNSYASQSSQLLNGLLKTELGFQGFVVSDWYGQHTGVASANAGLDLVMPAGLYWNGTLAQASSNGSLAANRLDDMATRVIASWSRYAQLDNPGLDVNANVIARNDDSHAAALQSAIEGHVLLKNVNNALPLSKPTALNIFGYDAISGDNTSASSSVLWPQGLSNTQSYTDGSAVGLIQFLEFLSAIGPPEETLPAVAINGTLIAGGGSGSVVPPLIISPFDALGSQASQDTTQVYTDFVSQNPSVMYPTAPCLVFVNAQASESVDRPSLNDEYSDTLITNVAAQCSNTIVVIHNTGIVVPGSWVDSSNVTALIYAHTPGENSGNALVEVLYGQQSPSGRLPYTVAYNETDYGGLLDPTYPTAEDPQFSQSNFSEGVIIDYRHFVANSIKPRYAFGFGLTYSDFNYTDIQIQQNATSSVSVTPPDAGSLPSEGGLDSLYDILTTISVTLHNTGNVAASEVAQLYLGIPNTGVAKALRGFEKALIQPGQSATVQFELRRKDLSMWNVVSQQWELQQGSYQVLVGKSVEDIQLTSTFSFQ